VCGAEKLLSLAGSRPLCTVYSYLPPRKNRRSYIRLKAMRARMSKETTQCPPQAVYLIERSQKQQQQHRQALSQNSQTSRGRRIVEMEVGGGEVRVEILKYARWNSGWANLVFPLIAEVGDYSQVPDSSDVFTSGGLASERPSSQSSSPLLQALDLTGPAGLNNRTVRYN
jgi:hypothetical protein